MQRRAEDSGESWSLRRARDTEVERAAREKAELHSLVQSNEVELARLRRLVAEGGGGGSASPSSSSATRDAPPPRSDAEQLLAMEARLSQLSDGLVTKQDALDATLAPNPALQVRVHTCRLSHCC